MESGRRRVATPVYQEEKQVLVAKRDRPPNLQAILHGYSACGGYILSDPVAPGVASTSTGQTCACSAVWWESEALRSGFSTEKPVVACLP